MEKYIQPNHSVTPFGAFPKKNDDDSKAWNKGSSNPEGKGMLNPGYDRCEFMSLFKDLPNQDPSFEDLFTAEVARSYNKKIVNEVITQLEDLTDVTKSATLKRMIKPPEDVLVNEKEYASSFVHKALAELQSATDKIVKELDEIELLMPNDPIPKRSKTKKVGYWMLFGTVAAAGIIVALWKFKGCA